MAYLQYRKQRPIKQLEDLRREKDLKQWRNYISYIDIVWKSKNNKPALLLLDEPQHLDFNRKLEQMSSNDLKTKSLNMQVYEEFDWMQIELNIFEFHKKYSSSKTPSMR